MLQKQSTKGLNLINNKVHIKRKSFISPKLQSIREKSYSNLLNTDMVNFNSDHTVS
jgi:hypothetical protein